MANQVDALTRKVYGHALLSPEDNSNLVGIKIKLDNQMLLEPDPALAPLYYKVGCMYKMREMTDYGTTLEGDTDVNNVETQLAYVGIALKDANGELRSTQDVLDDLGKK